MKWTGCARYGEHAGAVVGHLGIAAIVALSAAVCLGVAMRWFGFDTDWVFDLNLFALVWLAGAGAALTAVHRAHVTAGIALERFVPRARRLLNALRALLIIPFLLLVAGAGTLQAQRAFVDHEVTFDLAAWPVWIAQLSIPVGMLAWAMVEAAYAVRLFAGGEAPDARDIAGAE
jgi:TRAP-type C4-dicarboxylate transport system permease small subunit